MSTVRLALLPRPGADWRSFTVSAAKGKDRTIIVIPGEHVLVRWLDVAGKTPQQIRAAALAHLAPELAQSPSDCVAALGETRDGKRQVAVMSRAAAEGFLNEARARKLSPDAITPDVCLLSAPIEADAAIAYADNEVLVRGQTHVFVTQPDLLETFLAGASRTETTLEAEAPRSIRAGTLPDFLPSLPSARSRAAPTAQPRRIAWAMAAAIVLAIAAPWTNAIRLDMSARSMEREAERIAANALPNATQIRNARAQLRAALLPHTNGKARIETAAVLLGELTALPEVAIGRLDADADTPAVHADLTAATPEAVAPLRDRLALRNYVVEDSASETDAGLTAIDLVVRARP